MQHRGKMTISNTFYMMTKRWKAVAVLFCIGLALGTGFVVMSEKKLATGNTSVSNVSDVMIDDKQKEDIEGYRSYIENSAYMNLNPNDLHMHYKYYDIVWKEQGLSSADYESKNTVLMRTMTLFYPSDEFAKEIISYKDEYKNRALYEVVSVSRSGSTYCFTILYTNDYYVKDVCDVIDLTLKNKSSEWYSLAGEFEFTRGPETDKTIDGVTGGYKEIQDKKIAALTKMQAAIANNVPTSSVEAKDSKNSPLIVRVATVLLIGILWTLVAGIVLSLFEKKINSAKDVSNLIGKDVICIFKNENESNLDKRFYKNSDRYHNPELYLSILNKRITSEGIKRLFIYNCSNSNISGVNDKVAEQMKGIEVIIVEEKEFFLDMKENEAVIIIVKGGETKKESLYKMIELMNDIRVKCAGVVFAV